MIILAKVAIVTDSVACLPAEIVARYGIRIVPIKILFEDKIYRDGFDLAPSEAYKLLAKAPDYFSTSPSSPSDYIDVFNELAADGRDVFCPAVSSELSTTYNVACLAAKHVKQEKPNCSIEVMDSRNATASQGFIALAAAQTAVRGGNLEDVIKTADSVKRRVQMLLTLDTIRHAYRTGRVPKIATQMGSLLGVKPLLTIKNGVVQLVGIVRTNRMGVDRLIKTLRRRASGMPLHVAVMHTAVPEEAEVLKQRISDEFNCVELLLTEVSPIIGYAIGPGALGIAFYTSPS